MKKPLLTPCHLFVLFALILNFFNTGYADSLPNLSKSHRQQAARPNLIPAAPTLSTKAHILIDVNSGKVIAEKNAKKKLPPASLTKMMTLYVVSNALKSGQIHLDDKVRVSKKAWKTGGSRMFIREGERVKVEDLLQGIIVDSGNDACVAMAEYLAGSEKSFADLMNKQAKSLGMNDSHFTDSTGLPNPDHYTTAHDLAILGRALVADFPEYYHWYKQKWYTFNGIRQPNRNRLLWRDPTVDGIKTGHTNKAGYCLVSSAQRDEMRLLAVILGAKTDAARADNSQRLLNYGFRFFETHQLYKAQQQIKKVRVWKGAKKMIQAGLTHAVTVTIPEGQYRQLNVSVEVPKIIQAPISKGQKLGQLLVKYDDKIIARQDIVALEADPRGALLTRLRDGVGLSFHKWFGSD